WAELAKANLLGLAVPEEFGGSGLGIIEVCLVLEEQGRRVAPVPLAPTLVLGALTIAEWGSEAQRSAWLPGVVAGEVVLTAAIAEGGANDPLRSSVEAVPDGDGWRLSGTKLSVPSAHVATRILVPARVETGLAVFLVDPAAAGVTVEQAETTNRELHSHLTFDNVAVGPADLLGDAGGDSVIRWMVDRALVALCAIQVGVCEEAVRRAAEYTSNRFQFGRPLSTFQGAALKAADAYIDTEAMRATLWQAAWRLAEGADATTEVGVAKWWAAEGGHRVVHVTQHLHGGMGADVDYPVHRYFLWAKQIENMLGGATQQLARLGQAIADAAKRGEQVGVGA
ncbi:MAG TPA: acyl-CoA dehydrogenase family protein, partial [Acidimicrobiales bacterium]|nr:acyl-CoA dehydrogenase family protein [Acidimicrobiales bacterium]